MNARAVDAGRKEVQKFVDGLRQLNDNDMAVVIAVSTVIRINMEKEGFLPKNLFSDSKLPPPNELGRYQMDLNKLARQFNKMGQPTDALGTMLISFSLRCLNVVEFRPLGREIWVEVARGFPKAEKALIDGEETKGEKFPKGVWKAWREVPVGLEPMKKGKSVWAR